MDGRSTSWIQAFDRHAGWIAAICCVPALLGFAAALPAFSHVQHPPGLLGAVGVPRAPAFNLLAFVVPGLLGMNLMGSGIWGLGFSIVDARRKKLLKRMIATPMSRTQFLASFVLSRLTMLIIEVGALVGFGILVFGVPVRGSPLSLLAICLLAALAFGALGLLLASRTRTIEGASGLMNLVMLPMWIFSGVFFSASRFPDALQPVPDDARLERLDVHRDVGQLRHGARLSPSAAAP